MADEIGGLGLDGGETGGEVREDSNKVTEEAVQRVQDNQKKAQQVQQQIKKDKDTNRKLANFLTFLLNDIKNDTLIKNIYETFFLTTNKKIDMENNDTEVIATKKHINIAAIVSIFAPFYPQEITHVGLQEFFEQYRNFQEEAILTTYIAYIKHINTIYDEEFTKDKKDFIELLIQISEYYELIEKMTGDKKEEFRATVKKELESVQ